jgi:lipopolysaccharide exporter
LIFSFFSMAQFSLVQQYIEAIKGISRSRDKSGWSFARNVVILGGGSALAQGFTVLLTPVLTRIYPPASVGQFGLFSSFLNVGLVGISLKYELAILAVHAERKAAELAFAALLFAVPMSLLGAAGFYFLVHFSLLGFDALPSYASVLMLVALLVGAAFFALRYWFVRQERFTLVSQATVVQNWARSICQVVIGAMGFQLFGLLGGEVLGRCAGMSRMFREAWPKIRSHVFPIDRNRFREVLSENWQFPVYSFPSSLIDSLSGNISIPLIVLYYGSSAGGYFALVQRVLAVPMVLVGASVADAFHARLALYAREAPDRVIPLFRDTSAWLFGLGMIPAVILLWFAQPLFRIVFGNQWAVAGKLAAVLAPWFLAQFVVSPLSRLVFVLEGQRFKLIYDGLALTSMISVFVLSARRHFSLVQAVIMLSTAGTSTYVVYYFVLVHVLRVHLRSHQAATPSTNPASASIF